MSHTRNRSFRPWLCRLEERTAPAAGMLDPTFGVGGRVTTRFPIPSDDYGSSTAIDSLGRILVAGCSYTRFDTDYDFEVTRFLPSGALDTTFGGTGVVSIAFGGQSDDVAYGVAVDSLDRVVVAGYTFDGSYADFAVVRLTITGALDPGFDGDGKQTVSFGAMSAIARGVAIDSLDRVALAGYTSTASSSDCVVARLTAGGALDTTFDGDGRQTGVFGAGGGGNSVAVDSLDRVVVGGGTNTDFAVARLTVAGALDTSFDGDGRQTVDFGNNDTVKGVAIDSLNRVVVAGLTGYAGTYQYAVARLTAGGALDTSFDGDGKQTVSFAAIDYASLSYGVAVDSLDRVIVGGATGNGSSVDFAVARLTVTGALDTSFDGDGKQTIAFGTGDDFAQGVAIDSQDRVVVAGYTAGHAYIGRNNDFAVARLNTAGALDSSFDSDGKLILPLKAQSNASAGAVAVDSQGRIVVAGGASDDGNYTGQGSTSLVEVVRYTSAGMLDRTFGGTGIVTFAFPMNSGGADAVAVDSQGRILVAGTPHIGSSYDFAIARLTPAGALDTSFDGDGIQTIDFNGRDDWANSVAVDSLNRVIVAGYTAYNSFPTLFAVARLTVAGALDASFDSDGKQTIAFGTIDDYGYGVAVDSLNRIVVSGRTFNGSDNDFAMARLTTAGALDPSFDGDGKQTIIFGTSNEGANSVAIDSMDRVVVAGGASIGSSGDFAVARVTVGGALDTTFDGDGRQSIDFGAIGDFANGVAIDSQSRVVLCGYTRNASNIDFAVARLTAAGALDSSFDGDGQQTIAFGTDNYYRNGVAVDSANRVIVAGESDYSGRVFGVARLTGDTTTAAAQVNDGSPQRSRITSLTVRFSGQVAFSGKPIQAFTLVRNGGGAVTFSANVSVEYGGTVVVLGNFTGPETEFGSLRDGRYTLTAVASLISAGGQPLDGDANGTPGGDFVFGDAQGLFRFFGDANGDRHVDIADFAIFSGAFNSSSGQSNYLAYLDFNGDGHIDIADFGQFSVRLFTMLP